ncbi:gamma-glutamyltransferase [Denitromonas iodatirespirans]|uniref:Glutathione hydrolase proenzyme n=1 Tax=Denitromonas iodatirespirans TaxID=2795389 RepID=A0A944HDL3_DENI1|nr:gamma-glutamyltransferase [Denitromonas iodatirespirans]MBT0963862.1 gamma-glutamyltransferase [Denitromonas iodatirespirans]
MHESPLNPIPWSKRPSFKARLVGVIATAGLVLSAVPAGAQALAQAVEKDREMIVTANPLASAAGAKVLKNGGTAADAMVAAQAVLGLVEPQASGIGGGAFVVYYDAATRTTTTFDGREKAPAAATEDRFAGLGFTTAWQSGLSVGVPGTPRIMEVVHERYGRLPWPRLFQPAISLAQRGFKLTERTSSQVAGLLAANPSCSNRIFFRDPVAFAYFANPDCTAKPAGTLIRNKDYAHTLKMMRRGADAFYHGDIAADIAAAVQGDLAIPGDMTVADLANYEVIERAPVCFEYRGHNVCGMGPPSSGALAVGQILGILENFDLTGDPLDERNVHLFAEAGRLAFADRGLYVGDTDFVTVPVEGMLDKTYLASRAALIGEQDMGTAAPGTPPGNFDPSAPDNRAKLSGTSHISIVDRYGNALSMTTTIESSFGNGVMVRGFLLNNELTDFSFSPESNGMPVANRVQPNKRPRSSMSPSIVFDDQGRVELVTGSPGGSRIIGYTAQSIVNHIDFGLDPQESINTPHYQNRNGSTEIERTIAGITLPYDADALAAQLQARGHPVNVADRLESGLSIIHVVHQDKHRPPYGKGPHWKHGHPGKPWHHGYPWHPGKKDGILLIGGADKRRDGTVDGR